MVFQVESRSFPPPFQVGIKAKSNNSSMELEAVAMSFFEEEGGGAEEART